MRFLSLFALVLGISTTAYANPDMTRHGYTQCTACHISPNGGRMLSAYGRQLSEELLSTWSYKGEGQFLHGAVDGEKLAEKGIYFGGDVRSIQIHRENSRVKTGRFFLMQANLDFAVQKYGFTGLVSIGQIEEPMSGRVQGNLNSTYFYGMYNLTDTWTVRAGRFTPQFGLNLPDHILVTKQGLGFNPYLQYDTAETALLTENWSLFASQARTVDKTPDAQKENATILHANYNFAERFKVGGSHWYGKRENGDIRRVYGANAILGITSRLYNLTEIDWQHQATQDGMVAMSRLGYEVYKGITPYVQYQQQQTDLENKGTVVRYYTAGGQFFPRPHFELQGQWTKGRNTTEWFDEAFLLLHYYF